MELLWGWVAGATESFSSLRSVTRPYQTDATEFRRFPEPTALALDVGTRRVDGGRTLIGGSPMRLLRLSERGAAVVDAWTTGRPVGPSAGEQRLARRLVDAGVFHPVADPTRCPDLTVDVVIPVRDDTTVFDTIVSVARSGPRQIVVVDDASVDADAVARAVAAGVAEVDVPVRLERRRSRGGPGPARNSGWTDLDGDVVAFVDAGVVPEGDWLRLLLSHFVDDAVAAVAPRVRARPHDEAAPSWLDAYEAARSPLDMGPSPARVAPGTRVSYVPTAALAVRRDALVAVGGFDERLRFGEDVDLVWRLVAAGHDVRYEPAAEVTHPNRGSWGALARQRFSYGSSAAVLDGSHPGAVSPVAVNPWSLASWAAAALGGRRGVVAGAIVGAGSTAALVPRLQGRVDDPTGEALRLGGVGHLRAGAALARTCLRPWIWPLVAAACLSRRARRLLLAVAVGVPASEWVAARPRLDPLRWTVARLVDDAAYSAGVWAGCGRRRRWGAVIPTLTRGPWLGSKRPSHDASD